MVPLAPVTDADAIPHALAGALDLKVRQGDVLAACIALLGAGRHLLVVDNCEHLLAGRGHSGRLAASTPAPELTVLATSREPLGLPVRAAAAHRPAATHHAQRPGRPSPLAGRGRVRRPGPSGATRLRPGGRRPPAHRRDRAQGRRDAARHRARGEPALVARPGRPPRPPRPLARPARRRRHHQPAPDDRVVLRPAARVRAPTVPPAWRLPGRVRSRRRRDSPATRPASRPRPRLGPSRRRVDGRGRLRLRPATGCSTRCAPSPPTVGRPRRGRRGDRVVPRVGAPPRGMDRPHHPHRPRTAGRSACFAANSPTSGRVAVGSHRPPARHRRAT